MRTQFFYFLIIIIISACNTKPQKQSKRDLKSKNIKMIDSTIQLWVKQKKFSGNIFIADSGEVIFKKSYGFANIENKEPMTLGKSFQIASISKQFTATGIMILKEQNKLDYNNFVKQYLPDFPYDSVTIRQLLTHTSGMPDFFDGITEFLDHSIANGNKELYEALIKSKISSKSNPGENWAYCNASYEILVTIIEKISGELYNDFLTKNIFSKLDMNSTTSDCTYLPNAKVKNAVTGYSLNDSVSELVAAHKIKRNEFVFFLSKMEGDGSLYSTIDDLYKWEQSLYTNNIISNKTIEEAFTPGKLKNGKIAKTDWGTNYGFGFDISNNENYGKLISHGGGQAGFRSNLSRYIDKKITIIILSNIENEDFWGFQNKLSELYSN